MRLHPSPGPVYDVNPLPIMPRVHAASFSHKLVYDPDSTSITRLPLETAPGPGAYRVVRARDGAALLQAGTGRADAPAAPMSHAARIPVRGLQYLGHHHMRDAQGWFSPGPAAYAPVSQTDMGRAGPRPTMLGKNRDTVHAIPQTSALGPGRYNPVPEAQSSMVTAPAAVVGTAERAPDRVRQFTKQLYQGKEFQRNYQGLFSPGPAQYNVPAPFVSANKGAGFAPHPLLRPLPGGPVASQQGEKPTAREKQRAAATQKLAEERQRDSERKQQMADTQRAQSTEHESVAQAN